LRGGTGESTTAPGSLDALRQGKSAATPASSPLKDVFFDFDRYDLKTDARDTLRTNADWLKSNPSARIEIEGHCDDRGTNEYNLALGAKRAQAAKDYLVTLGILSERLSTISYGEEIPVCREQTESCWSRNRRARFVVIASRPAS
jgi:peptidoglycan-associated lipoprotein